jgi:hypothetical protein
MPTLDDIASALGDSTNNTTAFAQNNTDDYYLDGISFNIDEADSVGGSITDYNPNEFLGTKAYRLTVEPDGTGNEYEEQIFDKNISFSGSGKLSVSSLQSPSDEVAWYVVRNEDGTGTMSVTVSDGIKGSTSKSVQRNVLGVIDVVISSINGDSSSVTMSVNEAGGTGTNWKYYIDGNLDKEYICTADDPNCSPTSHTFYSISEGQTYTLKVVVNGIEGYSDTEQTNYSVPEPFGVTGVSAREIDSTTFSCSVGVQGGQTPYSYDWTADRGTFDDPNSQRPELTTDFPPTTYDYVYCTVTDASGATDSGSQQLG